MAAQPHTLLLNFLPEEKQLESGSGKGMGYWGVHRDDDEEQGQGQGLLNALKDDGNGGFNESEVRKAVRGLGCNDRMRL